MGIECKISQKTEDTCRYINIQVLVPRPVRYEVGRFLVTLGLGLDASAERYRWFHWNEKGGRAFAVVDAEINCI